MSKKAVAVRGDYNVVFRVIYPSTLLVSGKMKRGVKMGNFFGLSLAVGREKVGNISLQGFDERNNQQPLAMHKTHRT